jgi:hypothetical protein
LAAASNTESKMLSTTALTVISGSVVDAAM